MNVDGLIVPERLVALIDAGVWPRNRVEETRQNSNSLVSKDRIQLFAPEEPKIYLLAPPFHTVAADMRSNTQFWSKFGALNEISPRLALDIADFGIGSDAPIVLDYRQNPSCPSVLRLRWSGTHGADNHWVKIASSFNEFADILGFAEPPIELPFGKIAA